MNWSGEQNGVPVAERVSWCSGVTVPVTRDKVVCLVLNRDETYQGETINVCFRSRRYSRGNTASS